MTVRRNMMCVLGFCAGVMIAAAIAAHDGTLGYFL